MNTTVLQRAIEALKEEKPDISYIRGLLETLYELQPKPVFQQNLQFIPGKGVVPVDQVPTVQVEPPAIQGKPGAINITEINAKNPV